MPTEQPPGATAPAPTPASPSLALWQRLTRTPARALAFGALGAAAGAAYAHFIGCRTGTCPITSNVWVSAVYGATVGGLVGWPARSASANGAKARG